MTRALVTSLDQMAAQVRYRLTIELLNHRLRRVDRLLEAGRRREARRTMRIVERDCIALFRR